MPKAKRVHPDAAIFGQMIRSLRVQRGWTIRKCAQRLGVTPGYLGVLESGGNMLSLPLLLEIADVFHIAPSEFMRAYEAGRKAERESIAPAE